MSFTGVGITFSHSFNFYLEEVLGFIKLFLII